MQSEEKKALSVLRLEHAEDCLHSAQSLLQLEDYKGAANRSYYAVFHAMRAVLALDGVDMKKHSGIISEFRRRYIRTGIFDASHSKTISELYDIRTDSDYDDFFIVSKEETVEQVTAAGEFIAAVETYLKSLP